MAEFFPVMTVADFRLLDDGEVLEGYLDGFHGGAAPGSDRSRSFWHGWRNGRVDAGLAEPDFAQHALAQEFLLGARAGADLTVDLTAGALAGALN